MPDPITWYLLGRTVDDTQSIDEGIDAKLLTHNLDPSAHGQSGETVYEHRNDTDLDHLDGSIDFRKLAADKFLVMTQFVSLDGWDLSGLATDGIFGGRLYTTASADNESFLWFETVTSSIKVNYSKTPFFQTSIVLGSITSQNICFGCGTEYNNMDRDSFGFYIVNGTLYARWTGSAAEHTSEITGITLTDANVYRAFFDTQAQELYFYVNNVLEYTATTDLPSTSNNFIFTYWIKTLVKSVRSMYVLDLLWSEDR